METIDVVIVGAGVTGLAIANAVADQGRTVCVLERHIRPGLECSTHNSGVIHAGIYYPADSAKARLCVKGRELLYSFCETYGVPHARCGKFIVTSTHSEMAQLLELERRGISNGVEDLIMVEPDFVYRREPHVHAIAALWSPSTGIVEAESLVRTLLRLALAKDVAWLPGTSVQSGVAQRDVVEILTPRETIRARVVVNAAGLYADQCSKALGGETFAIYLVR